MSLTKSVVLFKHDTGYRDQLLNHINDAIRGKDMIAEKIIKLEDSEKQLDEQLAKAIENTPEKPAVLQKQEGGSHYKNMVIEPAEYITKNKIGFLAGNAIKYLSRYGKKNGTEDIKKAIHYCEMILEFEYGERRDTNKKTT